MRIVALVENTCGHEDCIAEHGLSLYIETEKHKLLLDTGQTVLSTGEQKTVLHKKRRKGL